MIRAEGNRLSLSGPLTITTVAGMMEEGREHVAGADRVVDLSGVTQVDSAALALLLSWVRVAKSAGRQLSIDHAPSALVSLASLYDVDTILPLAP
jgi:phospholipid transport system transporter-binding protein